MQNANDSSASPGISHAPRSLLREGLASGQIYAAFQPKVSLKSGAVIGVEALARWNSPRLGMVLPEIFIRMAEREGLIAELSALVLREALDACVQFRRHAPGLTMAVNIAPTLLADTTLPAQIERALSTAGLPPSALVAEITESQAIADSAGAAITLGALRAQGINCAIDDFGTGHASLLSLLRLPFSELKIDRAFVTHCATDRDAETIVRATLGLAHEMQLHVVAEGIESRDAETLLMALGCATGQGFHYGRAVSQSDIIAILSRSHAPARITA